MDFFNHFLPCVVEKHDWKWQTKKELISQVATISDEAFALLILENIWDEWKDMNEFEFFSRCKGMEKELRERRLEEDVGLVMQRDVENIVDGMLME